MKKPAYIILFLLFFILFSTGLFAQGFSSGDGSVVLKTNRGNLILTPYSSNIIRVALSETNLVATTDAIILKLQSVKYQKEEDSLTVKLITDSLTVSINKKTYSFRFFDKKNQLVARLTRKLIVSGSSTKKTGW